MRRLKLQSAVLNELTLPLNEHIEPIRRLNKFRTLKIRIQYFANLFFGQSNRITELHSRHFLTFAAKILRYEDWFCFYASRQESPAVRQW